MLNLIDYDFNANLHLYRWKDMDIILDVNSGAIHVIDEPAYQLLNYLIQYEGDTEGAIKACGYAYPAETIHEAMEEIEAAWRENALFTSEEKVDLQLAHAAVKALCLNVTHGCNMKCKYCFAQQGVFGLAPALMPWEVARRSLDFLLAGSGNIKNLEVDFFGGEPLLNFDIIRKTVAYGRKLESASGKVFRFTLTTNGLLLNDQIIRFIIENNISVILSLDGRKATHDRNRILTNGQGSYDLILPRIRKMVESHPVSYFIRGTFTRENLDFASDLQHFIELGFDAFSLEPAVGVDNEHAIKREDLPLVLTEYERLTDILLECFHRGVDVRFFHYNLDLQKGPCLAKRHTGCSAGVEYLVITPEGDIYPCHQFVGQSGFKMGNICDDTFKQDIKTLFAGNCLDNKPTCSRCWARNFCGGGCHANNYYSSGDIKQPDDLYCSMHKKRIEGAIFLDLQKKLASI